MWSRSKRDRCFRTSLLTINCAACVAIIYIYLRYVGEIENNHSGISFEDVTQPEKLTSEKCTPVCESRACMWHANMFLKHINSTVDPCEDFRSFLCSGFQREFGPEEKANVVSETRKPLLIRLKSILDNLQAEPGSATAKMKTVYDSCVNYRSSEFQGIREFKNIFNSLGFLNWPNLAQDFHFGDVSLPEILASFLAYGTEQCISLKRVRGNETEEDQLRVSFSRYEFNKTTEILRESAVSMLKYFDLEAEDIDMIIKDHELVKNSILNLFERYGFCNEETCPVIHINCSRENDEDWHEFCETLGFFFSSMNINDPISRSLIQIEIPEDSFFKNLFPLLHSLPNRSIANFVVLTFLKGYQAELNFYFRLSKLKHKDFEYEIEIEFYEVDRWRYCVTWIADNMKIPLENLFFRQYLTKSVTEEIINIYKNYSSEIIDLVTFQEWLPTDLRLSLPETLQSAIFNIDVLSRVFPNDTYVNKVYEKFIPTSESFLDNVLRLKKSLFTLPSSSDSFNNEDFSPYTTDYDVQTTAGTFHDIHFGIHPFHIPRHLETKFEVQAFAFSPLLEIHYGMLIPPFYIPGHYSFMNSVVLAPIVSHEIGHFIFEILEHELREDENFLEKQQCVRDQFSRFKFENLNENLNGSLYDIENIPDNIATTAIDKVIEKYSASQDIVLPGLPYSTKQLLYMSSVQIWCSKSSLEKDIHHKNIDTHAPTEFRLLGMMQNSRGHSEAFQCPEGSFMNPATKCSLLDTNGH